MSKFRVNAKEKTDLLAAIREADEGGSLPFDEAMKEVEEMEEEILKPLETAVS